MSKTLKIRVQGPWSHPKGATPRDKVSSLAKPYRTKHLDLVLELWLKIYSFILTKGVLKHRRMDLRGEMKNKKKSVESLYLSSKIVLL